MKIKYLLNIFFRKDIPNKNLELMERFNVKNLFFKIIDYSINKCSTIAKEKIYRTVILYNEKYKIKGFEI